MRRDKIPYAVKAQLVRRRMQVSRQELAEEFGMSPANVDYVLANHPEMVLKAREGVLLGLAEACAEDVKSAQGSAQASDTKSLAETFATSLSAD